MVSITHNVEKNGIELTFDNKPDPETLQWLKDNRYRWTSFKMLWYKKFNQVAWAEVHAHFDVPVTEPKQAEVKKPDTMNTDSSMIPPGFKKDVLFLISLQKDKQSKTRNGWDMNLFKSSLHSKLKTLKKNGADSAVNATLLFLKEQTAQNKLKPIFTPRHAIWNLMSATEPTQPVAIDKVEKPEFWKWTRTQFRDYWIEQYNKWVPEQVVQKSSSSGKWFATRPDNSPTTSWNTKKTAIARLKAEKVAMISMINKGNMDWEHKAHIENAINAGENIPALVLVDYPELKKEKVKPEREIVEPLQSFADYLKEGREVYGWKNNEAIHEMYKIYLLQHAYESEIRADSFGTGIKKNIEDARHGILINLGKTKISDETSFAYSKRKIAELLDRAKNDGKNLKQDVPVVEQNISAGPGSIRPEFMTDWQKFPMLKGREIQISMPNGEKRNAIFAIVELGNIIASHNEENFHSQPGYPKNASGNNINDRNYKDDLSAQKAVMDYARELEPERLITTSRTPSGTPIITKDGFVVSGNNRTMSLKLAAKQYPDNYKEYVKFLAEEIDSFGFKNHVGTALQMNDSIPIEGSSFNNPMSVKFTYPVLLRIDLDFPEYTTQELSKYNKDTKKAERPIDKAIKLSNILRENSRCAEIIAEITGEYDTFSEFYSNIIGQKKLAKTLIECNLLTEQEMPAYFSDTTFTETGKEFIENLLAALILDREALMAAEQPGIKAMRQKLITSLPVLMKNASLPEGSLKAYINDAVIFQQIMKTSGSEFIDFIRQANLFGTKYNRKTVYMNRLIHQGKLVFKSCIEKYNSAILQNQGESLFGDKPSIDDLFNQFIKKYVSETDQRLIEKSDVVSKDDEKAVEKLIIPDILYHSSVNGIESIPDGAVINELGIHLGSKETADKITESKGGTTRQYRVNLKNPLETDDFPRWEAYSVSQRLLKEGVLSEEEVSRINKKTGNDKDRELVSTLKSKGYDGFVYENYFEGGGTSYVVFDKSQVTPVLTKEPTAKVRKPESLKNHGQFMGFLRSQGVNVLTTDADKIADLIDKNYNRNQLPPASMAFQKDKRKCIDKLVQQSKKIAAKLAKPWEMTLETFATMQFLTEASAEAHMLSEALWIPISDYRDAHKKALEQAIANNEPIPDVVLADYPELGIKENTPIDQARAADEQRDNIRTEFLRFTDDIDPKDRLKIYLVNGNEVRKDHIEFTMGGHGYVYDYVPKDEIWIDENLKSKPEDMEATIKHEVFEVRKMRDEGLDYDTAHELANQVEKKVRQNDTDNSQYVIVNQNYLGMVAKNSIGKVVGKPNMFVTLLYFGKNQSGQVLQSKVDNTYLDKLKETPELVKDGQSEYYILKPETMSKDIVRLTEKDKGWVTRSFLSYVTCGNYIGEYEFTEETGLVLEWGKYGYGVAQEAQDEDIDALLSACREFNKKHKGSFIAHAERSDSKFNTVNIMDFYQVAEHYDIYRMVATSEAYADTFKIMKEHGIKNERVDRELAAEQAEKSKVETAIAEIKKETGLDITPREYSMFLTGVRHSRGPIYEIIIHKSRSISNPSTSTIKLNNAKEVFETLRSKELIDALIWPSMHKSEILVYFPKSYYEFDYSNGERIGLKSGYMNIASFFIDNIPNEAAAIDIYLLTLEKFEALYYYVSGDKREVETLTTTGDDYADYVIGEIEKQFNIRFPGEVFEKDSLIKSWIKNKNEKNEFRANSIIEEVYISYLPVALKPDGFQLLKEGYKVSKAPASPAPEKKLNPYIAIYKGKRHELYAETSLQAQIQAAAFFKVKPTNSHYVHVHLAEETEPKADVSVEQIAALRKWMPAGQIDALMSLLRSEEREAGIEILNSLSETIATMPKLYETEDTQTEDKIVYLHYFRGGSDFYIVEKDTEPVQHQAFGYSILNGDLINAEWGYISIVDLIQNNIELDFHWQQRTFKEVMSTIFKPKQSEEVVNPSEFDPDRKYEKKFKVYEFVKMIDTAYEPTMKFYNKAELLRYVRFLEEDNTWLVEIEMLQDLGRRIVKENNLLPFEEKTENQPSKLPMIYFNGTKYFIDFKLQEIRNNDTAQSTRFTDIESDELKAAIRLVRAESGPNVNMPGLDDTGADAIIKPDQPSKGFQKISLAPPVAKLIEYLDSQATAKQKAAVWNEGKYDADGSVIVASRDYIVKGTGNTLWQLAIKAYPAIEVVQSGKEPIINWFGSALKQYISKALLDKGYELIDPEITETVSKPDETVSKTDISVSKADYKNEFDLNKGIEALLDKKWNDKTDQWSAEELEFIKGYTGYGGLDNESNKAGVKLDVKSLFEYFTPDQVIEKMWGLAYKYGYKDGPVLEPSCGIGPFFDRRFVSNTVVKHGYEINKYSARICKLLYPEAIINDGKEVKFFEELFIVNNYTVRAKVTPKYRLVIGNPPYGTVGGLYMGMGEKNYTHANNFIDYFILRGLDLLEKDGLLIYIIGAETAGGGVPFLDQGMNKVKQMISERGKLIDAYRLPSGVFARTDVTSDIVVFRKR